MNEGDIITINKRKYTVKSVFDFEDGHSLRVFVETKNGDSKTALFYDGEFDVWESGSSKPAGAYGKNRRTINWRA